MRASALELFGERGFHATTVQEIVDRAGVTERTFYRHFVNKEEVLFSDEGIILDLIVRSFSSMPRNATPRQILEAVATQLGEEFEPTRATQRVRVAILASEPALMERELLKQEKWSESIAKLFQNRGVPSFRASIIAAAATATFRTVYLRWATDNSRVGFATRVKAALQTLGKDIA